jgi:hypothetical protein
MKKISALATVLLIATVIGGPAALAQTTGTPNNGGGVLGLPRNKSGPAAKKEQNPSGQWSHGKQQAETSGSWTLAACFCLELSSWRSSRRGGPWLFACDRLQRIPITSGDQSIIVSRA